MTILIFMCYSFFTFFWSPAKIEVNLYYFFYLILDISLFYFLYHVVDDENFHRKLMWCLLFSGIALSMQVFTTFFYVLKTNIAFPISDWLFFNLYQIPMKGQNSGWFVAYAGTSITLNIVIFVAVGLLLTEKNNSKRVFLMAAIVICCYAVFLTKNKGGIWSLVMSSYLFLVLSEIFRKKLFRNAIILFTIFLFIFSSVIAMRMSKRGTFRAVDVSTTQSSSVGQRLQYWGEGFRQINNRSLIAVGLGIGGFTALNKLKIVHPHNLYLHMFFDFGFVGIIIACVIIVTIIRSFLKMKNYQESYLQNMFIAFTVNLFCIGLNGLIIIPYYSGILWFSLAMFFLTLRLMQKELSKIEKDKEKRP